MDTIGSLIDKLTIANIRLWHLEDRRRDKNLSDADRLKAADMASVVNSQRNDIIDEIDKMLADAIKTGNVAVQPKMKLY